LEEAAMMTTNQFEQTIRPLLQAQPFQPFVIERAVGDQFLVYAPTAVRYHEGGRAIYFHADGNMDFINCEVVTKIYRLVPEPAGS
jgi:hypothetical protein